MLVQLEGGREGGRFKFPLPINLTRLSRASYFPQGSCMYRTGGREMFMSPGFLWRETGKNYKYIYSISRL